jgi:Arm DNA-binding domain
MLTDTEIKNAKPGKNPRPGSPQGKDYKLAAGNGLYVLVTTKGGKWWRYKYRVLVGTEKVERMGSLGTYPDVSLKDARIAHADALKLLRDGEDPVEVKRKQKATKGIEREKNRGSGDVRQQGGGGRG